MFSGRLPPDLAPNAIARLRERLGEELLDLTVSNPTRCDIDYPASLLAAASVPDDPIYRPEPLGLPEARRAVALDYRRGGLDVDAGAVVLTASTSEAYGFLFKLLCDPGDTVLVPRPSYPLLEHLAALEGVDARPYSLDAEDDWQPISELPSNGPLRALVVVHPNNPTGSYLTCASAVRVSEFCANHGAALVADEVFRGFPLSDGAPSTSFAGRRDALTFTLGGLSKHVGLPQLKLSWIVVTGPAGPAREALERLGWIADSYLSVGSAVQTALPRLLSEGAAVRRAILERCRGNLASLAEITGEVPGLSVAAPEGGWSAVVRFPAVVEEEALVLELLERDRVAVHPGYFFDFPRPGHLVLSLLPSPGVWQEGVRRLAERLRTRTQCPGGHSPRDPARSRSSSSKRAR